MDLLCESGSQEDEGISEVSPCGRFVRSDEVLGRGAFKIVYKGFDLELGTEVAWCQININRDIAASSSSTLLSEASLMKSVEHENVIKCHSWWIDRAKMNINMITEFFSSGTLRQYRNKHKSLNIEAIKNWGQQILKGLHYLHTHHPPIVHRDLKCDNVFVNGNNGQVKIGDLGMATFKQHHCPLRSVLGTPEFMAPELYDEDYNDLVDVYSFGMCMLELITCEYPYSECNNVAQIFKKVTTGVKPLALGRVKNEQVKGLIEKCLLPASRRPRAADLLNDSFFSSSYKSSLKVLHSESRILFPSGPIMPKSTNFSKPQSPVSESRASSCDKLSSGTSSLGSCNGTPPVSKAESSMYTDHMQLGLKGKRIDSQTISFNLRIADDRSHMANCFEFAFDLKADDALKIALEMVDGNDLSYHQVPVVVELIDSVLLELEPSWIPCRGFQNQANVVSGCRALSSNWQFSTVVH